MHDNPTVAKALELFPDSEVVAANPWPVIFERICERVNEAVDSCRFETTRFPCPDCRGYGGSCCHGVGTRAWKYISTDTRARLALAIKILEHDLKTRGPEERHWIERAATELRELLESKYDKGKQNVDSHR